MTCQERMLSMQLNAHSAANDPAQRLQFQEFISEKVCTCRCRRAEEFWEHASAVRTSRRHNFSNIRTRALYQTIKQKDTFQRTAALDAVAIGHRSNHVRVKCTVQPEACYHSDTPSTVTQTTLKANRRLPVLTARASGSRGTHEVREEDGCTDIYIF